MKPRKIIISLSLVVIGLGLLIVLYGSDESSARTPMDSFWDVVKNRRSVREFRADPIPEKDLIRIVDAARMAPNAGNEQPWKFLIVQDKARIETMREELVAKVRHRFQDQKKLRGEALEAAVQKHAEKWINGRMSAPVYIVVLVDRERKWPDYNSHDGPLAAGYLLLAARALGYGTVYMSDSIPEEIVRRVLNIPERYQMVCITPVGVPVEWPEKKKKPLDDLIVRDTF